MTDLGRASCEHLFERFRPWPIRYRWRCVTCGLITRHYDGADWAAGRPIHPKMVVAWVGVNTLRKGP